MGAATILIPAYNAAATIGETLQSLQDCSQLKGLIAGVCVADDASTDQTISVARSAWKEAAALTIVRNEHNRGERATVNSAMAQLGENCDWVYVLHADDLVKKDWVETIAGRIKSCDPSVASICSSWDVWYPDRNRTYGGEEDPHRGVELIAGTPDSVLGTLMKGCWWHLSGCAIRVSAFRSIGGFAEDFPQLGDWDWLLRCLEAGFAIEYIPRSLMVYRMHEASVSSESFRSGRDLRERIRILGRYEQRMPQSDRNALYAGIRRSAIRRIVKSLLLLRPSAAFDYARILSESRTPSQ